MQECCKVFTTGCPIRLSNSHRLPVKICNTLPALGSAAATNYCKLTGLTWDRRKVPGAVVCAQAYARQLRILVASELGVFLTCARDTAVEGNAAERRTRISAEILVFWLRVRRCEGFRLCCTRLHTGYMCVKARSAQACQSWITSRADFWREKQSDRMPCGDRYQNPN